MVVVQALLAMVFRSAGRLLNTAFGWATVMLSGRILMTIFAPVLRVRDLFRRWTTQHVPVMVEPQDYAGVVDDIDHALRDGGMTMTRGRPSWMLRLPTRLLGWFAGAAVGELVAEQLTRLYAPSGARAASA